MKLLRGMVSVLGPGLCLFLLLVYFPLGVIFALVKRRM